YKRLNTTARSSLGTFHFLISLCVSAQIKTMVNQLGTRQDTSELQDRLQQTQHYTNQLAKETNKHLKELGSIPLPSSPSEQVSTRLHFVSLFFDPFNFKTKEKNKPSIDSLVSFDNQDEWGQMTTQTEEAAITEEDLELIKERETNIRQLESDIMDVNQIFKDLAVMIHDQGEMIDSIEANVENAEVHVERGTEQLQRAAYYQQKSRKKICILVMVCSIVLVILAIIIWWASK
uniref:Syntaxin 12 n=1 Tax=Oreochromis niloticus TaxID=8128 RepID=A0A669EZS9_ORENI